MLDIISNEMMRKADRYTIDALGITGEELMMRASVGVMNEVLNYDKIAIIAGKGNNGGDGICLAYLLINKGIKPDLYMFSRATRGESKYYYDMICDYENIRIIDGSEDFSKYDVVVDAIFGTGLARDVEGIYKTTIDAINMTSKYVVSVDIPSGLNGDNGAVNNVAVRANKTVSINTRKLGQYLQNGKDYVGEIVNVDIGIKLTEKPYNLLNNDDIIIAKRLNNSHKGTYGSVALIGGSQNYVGASKLAYMGANSLMAGAGLVRLCVPRDLLLAYASEVVECTLYPMTALNGNISYNESELCDLLASRVIAIGMGIGEGADVIKILEYLLKNYTGRLLIDADGINALSKNIDLLINHKPQIVLTPHVKEMARLSGLSVNEILNNPVDIAKDFASKYDITLLLKGTSTIVTDGMDVYIVDRGSPAMAKGGSGDVLSGITAGLLAHSDLDVVRAVYTAAYVAGEAGEMAEQEYGTLGALARDTARFASYAIKNHEK